MDLRAQVESIVEKILPAVEAVAARLEGPAATAAARLDPRELERQCRDLGLAVGHELFVGMLQEYGDGQQGPRVRCACGGTRRWVDTRPRTMRDLMNREVTLARAYYDCPCCGQGWLPLDEALGLTSSQVTPALYEVAVTCGSVAPPEEAAEGLALVAGVQLSPKSIERYTKAAGAATDWKFSLSMLHFFSPILGYDAPPPEPAGAVLDGRSQGPPGILLGLGARCSARRPRRRGPGGLQERR